MTSSPTILVIEDSEEDFAMIRHGLAESGIRQTIEHLIDAKQVHDWLDNMDSRAGFIMLDLNLPGESGLTLIKAFKSHPKHGLTPLAVLSTSTSHKDIEASYGAGANTYHVKPLETPRFHALIKRIAAYWFCDALRIGGH